MKRISSTILIYMTLLVVGLLFISPVGFMLAGSLKPDARVFVEAGGWRAFWPAGMSLDNYRDVFVRVDFLRYLFNSLLINGMIVGTGLLVNSLAGYAFARLQWRGRDVSFRLVLAVLIIPLEAIAVPLFSGDTIFATSEGSEASSTLNAVKKINRPSTIPVMLE